MLLGKMEAQLIWNIKEYLYVMKWRVMGYNEMKPFLKGIVL